MPVEREIHLPYMTKEAIARLTSILNEEFGIKELAIEAIDSISGKYLVRTEKSCMAMVVLAAFFLDIEREETRNP